MISRLVYRLLRICRINCTLDEVRRRRYEIPSTDVPPAESSTDAGLEQAKELALRLEEAERKRRSDIDDKSKWLFGLVSALLTVMGAVLSQAPFWVGLAGIFGVVLLTTVALLLLWYFGINDRASPAIDAALLQATDARTAQHEVIKSIVTANEWNAAVTSFHVDIYRAARRITGTSLFVVAIMALIGFGTRQRHDDLVSKVRSDRALVDALRGPAGPMGSPGIPGRQGSQGPTGPIGKTANCRCK